MLVRDWSKHVTWLNISQLKLRIIQQYFLIFKTAHAAKKIWRIINTLASFWRENMLRYLSLGIICSSKPTVFLELLSQKTVRFSEQIKSVDKYPSIFTCQVYWSILFIYPTYSSGIVDYYSTITRSDGLLIITQSLFSILGQRNAQNIKSLIWFDRCDFRMMQDALWKLEVEILENENFFPSIMCLA